MVAFSCIDYTSLYTQLDIGAILVLTPILMGVQTVFPLMFNFVNITAKKQEEKYEKLR